MKNLTHITDVGSPDNNGSDSTHRIRKQYQRLGVLPNIITAGHSPLHVAFTGCTDIHPKAISNALEILKLLEINKPKTPPTALNSAPRNSNKSQYNGQEDHIYRVKHDEDESLLIYGPEVLQWVLAFRGRIGLTVERILEIPGVITNTSNGSQFRSAEHLPIVHFLEAINHLDENSERRDVDPDQIENIAPIENDIIIIPPDEYNNGRILTKRDNFRDILERTNIKIAEIYENFLTVKQSLTEVNPGELSVWPSSNHLPGGNLEVLNIGTRWSPGQTRTTDRDVIELSERLNQKIGARYKVS